MLEPMVLIRLRARRWLVRRLLTSLPALTAAALAGVACGSFGSDSATTTAEAGGGEAGPSIGSDGGATDAAADADDGGARCTDLLEQGQGLAARDQSGGSVTLAATQTVVRFLAKSPDAGVAYPVVRADRTITMPSTATLLRLDADVEIVAEGWNGTAATWSGDAYLGVLGVLAGTSYGTNPQASISLGSAGATQLNVFPDGTDTQATQRTAPGGTIPLAGGRMLVSFVLDYGALTMSARAIGTVAGRAFLATSAGPLGLRPQLGDFTVYVGGGAGGAAAPTITLTFTKLCVAFAN
jgi:hypothetical protein